MSRSNEQDWPTVDAAADVAYDPVEEEHISAEALYNTQRRIITIPIEGTLEELNRKSSKTNWKFHPQNYTKLQQVTSTVDRRKPLPQDLAGDLDRAVLLNAEIIEHSNMFPCAIDVDISTLVPISLTSTHASTWTIEPHTAPTMVNVNVFAPTDIISKRMFRRIERCDRAMLDREFVFPKAGDTSGKMLMATDGIAMEVLRDSPQSFPGLRLPAVDEGTRYVDLPQDVAMAVYDYMKAKIDRIEQSFVSLKNLEANWSRSGGQKWNDVNSLIGEAASVTPDAQGEIKNLVLNTVYRASIKVCLDFALFGNPNAQ